MEIERKVSEGDTRSLEQMYMEVLDEVNAYISLTTTPQVFERNKRDKELEGNKHTLRKTQRKDVTSRRLETVREQISDEEEEINGMKINGREINGRETTGREINGTETN